MTLSVFSVDRVLFFSFRLSIFCPLPFSYQRQHLSNSFFSPIFLFLFLCCFPLLSPLLFINPVFGRARYPLGTPLWERPNGCPSTVKQLEKWLHPISSEQASSWHCQLLNTRFTGGKFLILISCFGCSIFHPYLIYYHIIYYYL